MSKSRKKPPTTNTSYEWDIIITGDDIRGYDWHVVVWPNKKMKVVGQYKEFVSGFNPDCDEAISEARSAFFWINTESGDFPIADENCLVMMERTMRL